MNSTLVRAALLFTVIIGSFNLGRISIEFSGKRSDWAIIIGGLVTLIGCLIGLMAGELVLNKPKGH
jgi:hypothetical protein